MLFGAGKVQRGLTIGIGSIDIGTVFKQKLHDVLLLCPAGNVQQAGTAFTTKHTGVGTFLQQSADNASRNMMAGVIERG